MGLETKAENATALVFKYTVDCLLKKYRTKKTLVIEYIWSFLFRKSIHRKLGNYCFHFDKNLKVMFYFYIQEIQFRHRLAFARIREF